MTTVLLALAFGAVIGVSLGALGGGGSILTVPVLVYVIGEAAGSATTASLVIVGITALVSSVGHARSGNVRWAAGTVFGVIGIAASYFGTELNRQVDPNTLLLAFAVLMLIAAVAMLRRASRSAVLDTSRHRRLTPVLVGGAAAPPIDGDLPDADAAPVGTLSYTPPPRTAITAQVAGKVIAAGLVVGFLTGFLGVGGGFIIVPALVMALEFPMPIAVGTSLLVIAINSAASLVERAGHESFHWSVIVPFTLAAVIGSVGGKRAADRASGDNLSRAFAMLLVAVAAYVAIRSGMGLS